VADDAGNVYATGYVYGSVTVAGTTIGGAGWYDAFLAKLDANGNWVWAKSLGGGLGDFGYFLGLDSVGNLIWYGNYTSTLTFAGTTLNYRGGGVTSGGLDGGGDHFLAKVQPDGTVIWIRTLGSTGVDVETSLEILPGDRFVLTGTMGASTTVGSANLPAGAFYAIYDSDGNPQVATNLPVAPGGSYGGSQPPRCSATEFWSAGMPQMPPVSRPTGCCGRWMPPARCGESRRWERFGRDGPCWAVSRPTS